MAEEKKGRKPVETWIMKTGDNDTFTLVAKVEGTDSKKVREAVKEALGKEGDGASFVVATVGNLREVQLKKVESVSVAGL